MAPQRRKILVTTALPYANGPIHMGHMVEYIQADIWVRFQRLIGNEAYFFCADDTHGTPIYIRARNEKRSPEDLIAEMFKLHTGTFQNFSISFDHYSSTNSPTTRQLSESIYRDMRDKGHTATRNITQTYCANDKMFLPDRLVRGTCPNCKSPNQYGDSCDVCGKTYAPTDLINPACSLCGTPPTHKDSEHIFFKLNDFRAQLEKWVPEMTSPEITKKLNEWLKEDLRDWDISRDEPYFGFKIPETENKYFYVWVDAPIGYMACSKDYFAKNNATLFEEFWKSDKTELYHFIGKDIVYFHTLFWPAMLHNAGYRTPSAVNVHGFLTVNGEKMSKSKGTFINADTYLKHLDSNFLRYYYASKLTDGVDDLDLNLDDFVLRVNSDLVGKFINLGSRSAQMLHKNFGGKLANLDTTSLKFYRDNIEAAQKDIGQFYENREFSKAMNTVRECADKMNKYFDEKAPWKTIKEDEAGAHQCLSLALLAFRALGIYLQPVMPQVTANIAKLFGESSYKWSDLALDNFKPTTLQPYTHLMQRVDPEKVKAMIEDSKVAQAAGNPAAAKTANEPQYIEIDDFNKIDLRIAKVIAAEEVKDSDKLLQLKVSLGTEERTILAGIKKSYKPETLVGRQVLVVANLKPRKMKFGTSEGMVLCASEGESLFVLSPDTGAGTGSKVK